MSAKSDAELNANFFLKANIEQKVELDESNSTGAMLKEVVNELSHGIMERCTMTVHPCECKDSKTNYQWVKFAMPGRLAFDVVFDAAANLGSMAMVCHNYRCFAYRNKKQLIAAINIVVNLQVYQSSVE